MNTNILHRSLMGGSLGGQPIPLYIEAVSGSVTVLANFEVNSAKYSSDAKTWSNYTDLSTKSLSKGQRIYFRCSAKQDTPVGYFGFTGGQVHIGGNAMSLIYDANFVGQTSLANYLGAFVRLFYDNPNIISVDPELFPAITLSSVCYAQAFMSCTSLVAGPDLPAPALTQNCYQGMYDGCSSLNYIKMLATTPYNASSDMLDWTYGVASSGTFVKHPNNTWITTGTSGIPSGWTVKTATK